MAMPEVSQPTLADSLLTPMALAVEPTAVMAAAMILVASKSNSHLIHDSH